MNQRIKYDFGPEYGITIESVPGEYTTMRILIPCVIPGDEDISIPENPLDEGEKKL